MPDLNLWLTDAEYAALQQLARDADLTLVNTMRQALRTYQMYRAGLLVAVPSDSPGCGGDD